ncbi:MAG TPA: NAD(P)-binding domain-containing protein [Spirochaetia bacterium]|nr:NAD(P)-binding domain-containing protein [Spirochaetia bacterium]
MKRKIAIIGRGNVGRALNDGITKAGYETRMSGKGPTARESAAWGDVIILAVPFGAVDAVVAELGSAVDGKTIIDVTNVLGPGGQLALGFTTSGAEQLQKKAPSAKVVKAFNAVFAQNMASGKVQGKQISCFAAGDDAAAKGEVLQLARDIGFDAVDAGPLVNARWLEAMGFQLIQLGYVVSKGLGAAIGFSLVR